MTSPTRQREFAEQVVQQLRAAGYEALWAGGCVRDELLGRTPKDYDVATSARPEQVRELFGKRRTLAIGAAFGVIAVMGGKELEPIEVATFRNDGAYLDGRRPSEVEFSTAEEDAQRRDFTINGLFFDPAEQRVIDYVGGEQDLEAGVVRAIGEAQARFTEDKLRMLRAVRFATTFGFAMDPMTLSSIQAMANEVTVVSAERIGVELRKILQHAERSHGLELLRETRLLQPLLPRLADLATRGEPEWKRLLDRLRTLETDSMPVAFAALFCDASEGQVVREAGRSFRFTNKEIDRSAWLVETLPFVAEASQLAWPQLQRILVHDGAGDLMLLAEAALGTEHAGAKRCREKLALPPEQLNPPLLVTGDDLVGHGFKARQAFRSADGLFARSAIGRRAAYRRGCPVGCRLVGAAARHAIICP